MTKSAQVRAMIAKAKAEGKSAEELFAAVQKKFDFTRALARTYVLGNWEKVEAAEVGDKLAARRARDAQRKREKRAAAKAAAEAV